VDGNRIHSWANSGSLGKYESGNFNAEHNGVYKITIGVEAPALVLEFRLSGGPELASLKKVSREAKKCPLVRPRLRATCRIESQKGSFVRHAFSPQELPE
jgi:hypothetical protein